MFQIILIFHVVFAISLVVLVLIQQGKGASMGASFGSGASQTVFGSQGAGSFMMKFTGFIAFMFFVTSLWLGHLSGHAPKSQKTDVLSQVTQISKQQQQQQTSDASTLQAIKQLNAAPKK
jgi:preprotein translocase subunit SecG